MDGKKVLEVVSIYRSSFKKMGICKLNPPHDQLVGGEFFSILAHCCGMLDKIEKFVAEGRMEKVFRWLGFVQGCLWSAGFYTLEELKNHNRPDSISRAD